MFYLIILVLFIYWIVHISGLPFAFLVGKMGKTFINFENEFVQRIMIVLNLGTIVISYTTHIYD